MTRFLLPLRPEGRAEREKKAKQPATLPRCVHAIEIEVGVFCFAMRIGLSRTVRAAFRQAGLIW
jgi:hypothetical protein